jgi:hypothetical protein
MPEAPPLPAWILAGPAAPLLHADEEMEPAGDDMSIDDADLAAPPPLLPCLVHGWACPRLAQQGIRIEEADPGAPAAPWLPGSLDLPSPTPAHEPSRAGREPCLHAPVTTASDVLGNGAGSSAAAAPPPPHRFRFVEPPAVLEASHAGHRPEELSPARFLANGHSNGVAPGTRLPGGSSSEEDEGAPGTSASRR